MIGSLKQITSEAEDIKGFRIKIPESFASFKPGQYVMLSFPDAPDVKRAFSVVSYDNQNRDFIVMMKKSGSFTTRMFNAGSGQELNVYGPYGRFVLPDESHHLIFIAGGIGITPLYSMMRHIELSDYDKRLYLYYLGKSRNKMALLSEISSINNNKIKADLIFTEEGGSRITAHDIRKSVPEFNESMFYICGPTAMIEGMRKGLMETNISEERIKSEEFN